MTGCSQEHGMRNHLLEGEEVISGVPPSWGAEGEMERDREGEGEIGSETGSLHSPLIITWADNRKCSLRQLFWFIGIWEVGRKSVNVSSRVLQLKMWLEDQQHRQHQGACWKCWMSGPALDLVSQSLHPDQIPDDFFARYSLWSTTLGKANKQPPEVSV